MSYDYLIIPMAECKTAVTPMRKQCAVLHQAIDMIALVLVKQP